MGKTKEKPLKKNLRYFLVTDRVSLDKGYIKILPIALVVGGKAKHLGSTMLSITNGIATFEDDGSVAASAVVRSASRMNGVVELTKSIIEEIVKIGITQGIIEEER